jgi:hypothetical protein
VSTHRPEIRLAPDESALFLAVAARDGVRLADLDRQEIPRGEGITAIGGRLGIGAGDVAAFCELWVGRGWYDYYEPHVDAGWVTDMGKVAALYLWTGEKPAMN